MTTKEKQISKAFDSATFSGKLISLSEEQATEFVDYVIEQSVLLKKARVVRMIKPIKTIAKLIANGRFLKPGQKGVAVAKSEFGSDSIELKSELLKGSFIVYDEELEDNIEGTSIGEHLARIVAKKVANELEEIGIYSRKLANPAGENAVLNLFDGFLFRIMNDGNVVDASVGFSDRYVAKDKLVKGYKALPTKFRKPTLNFFMPDDIAIDYNILFDANYNRNTLVDNILGKPLTVVPLMSVERPVADGVISTTASGTNAAGQKVLNVASGTGITAGQHLVVGFETAEEQVYTVASVSTNAVTLVEELVYAVTNGKTVKSCTLDGAETIITDPQNLIYGIQVGGNGIQFETQRKADIAGTEYHFRMRCDFQVEEATAASVIKKLKVR